jgi:hypothetical protein
MWKILEMLSNLIMNKISSKPVKVINDGFGAMFTISGTLELTWRVILNEFSIDELKLTATKSIGEVTLKYLNDWSLSSWKD